MASDAEDTASPEPDFDAALDHSETMTELNSSAVKAESNASPSSNQQSPANGSNGHGKPNPKDPSRPRRKKARRACFACQRAHLTCGDERPCQRCIKRGLQDQCHDGIRKKAKYLIDTPAELLDPPGLGAFHPPYINGTKASSTSSAPSAPVTESTTAGHYAPAPQPQTPTIDIYGQGPPQTRMGPPLSAGSTFGNQQSPISPQFGQQSVSQAMTPTMTANAQNMTEFNPGPAFDPSDPGLFNFDIQSLNFGNSYGALEFGMLAHMSSGVNGDVQRDMLNPMNQMQGYGQNYQTDPGVVFQHDAFINADWNNSSQPRANSASGMLQTPNNTPVVTSIDRNDSVQFPSAYAIGAGPGSMASASPAASTGVPDSYLDQPQSPALFLNTSQPPPPASITRPTPSGRQQQVQLPPDGFTTTAEARAALKRTQVDAVYASDTKPYSYTRGFHRLFHYITQNFSIEKKFRIVKAMSSFRPSLITFSQSLTELDLDFMERSLQRKLLEFNDFIIATGTPCVLARRDGAILMASKEFCILTGWPRAVLLGREANLNINSGGASGPSTTPGSASRTRLPSSDDGNGTLPDRSSTFTSNGPNASSSSTNAIAPVLLAEILDQDSVVQFYEDYAKLAFGDPAGRVMRRGRLLKYRTANENNHNVMFRSTDLDDNNDDAKAMKKRKKSAATKQEKPDVAGVGPAGLGNQISNEANIQRLGEREGSVDVMLCWKVRRDIFEVPSLIVVNILPVIG